MEAYEITARVPGILSAQALLLPIELPSSLKCRNVVSSIKKYYYCTSLY